jgi:hypothetical protein
MLPANSSAGATNAATTKSVLSLKIFSAILPNGDVAFAIDLVAAAITRRDLQDCRHEHFSDPSSGLALQHLTSVEIDPMRLPLGESAI